MKVLGFLITIFFGALFGYAVFMMATPDCVSVQHGEYTDDCGQWGDD